MEDIVVPWFFFVSKYHSFPRSLPGQASPGTSSDFVGASGDTSNLRRPISRGFQAGCRSCHNDPETTAASLMWHRRLSLYGVLDVPFPNISICTLPLALF